MKINLTLEQALTKASPKLKEKIIHSVELLRKSESLALLYDSEDGFWLGFSGGKDSQALIHIAQLAGVKFKAYFSPTSVDPPEVIRFIRREYPEVQFTKLKESIYQVFLRKKCLPSMKIRWCCAEFKEKGGENKVTLVGVRHAESVKRSKRNEVEVTGKKFSGDLEGFKDFRAMRMKKKLKRELTEEEKQFDQFSEHKETMISCLGGKDKIVISPIIDWDDEDVWEFINDVVEVPHCELYEQGQHRIGCICCPMATTKNIIAQVERYPHVKERWIQSIMKLRKDAMSQENTPPFTSNSRGYTNYRSQAGRFLPPTRPFEDREGGEKYLAPTDRNMGGKFLDSDNGDSSAVVAEYNEQRERQVAEAIWDWWISKLSYKDWYAKKYKQQHLDL